MRPHERLAVGHGEVGAEDGVAQLGVLLAGHHGVDGGDADVAALRRVAIVASIQSIVPLVVGQRERDAEDLDAGRRHGSLRERGALGGVGARRVSACGRARAERTRVRHATTQMARGSSVAARTCIGCRDRAESAGHGGFGPGRLVPGRAAAGRPRLRGRRPRPRGRRARCPTACRRVVAAICCDPATLRARRRTTCRPDELYHLAAPTFVPDSWEDPTETVAAIAGGDRDAAGGRARGRPGHARVGLDLERGLRRRGREPAERAHPDAPAHALRRGEARRARPRGRDARALRALRVLGADLQPRVAAAPRALPHAQGHARRRGDQARPRATSSSSATSTRCATGRTPPTSCAPRGWRCRRRRARRLRHRLGRRAHRARPRRRRLRRASTSTGRRHVRVDPALRARARAGRAGRRPDARPRAPRLGAASARSSDLVAEMVAADLADLRALDRRPRHGRAARQHRRARLQRGGDHRGGPAARLSAVPVPQRDHRRRRRLDRRHAAILAAGRRRACTAHRAVPRNAGKGAAVRDGHRRRPRGDDRRHPGRRPRVRPQGPARAARRRCSRATPTSSTARACAAASPSARTSSGTTRATASSRC